MPEAVFDYVGSELEIFSHAYNWKRYWQSRLARYVKGSVLEVGAGIGANSPFFLSYADHLTLCEPDAAQAAQLSERFAGQPVTVQPGAIASVSGKFDAIFYIDVLEHIEADRAELAQAATRLNTSGVIVVLSPAHMALYSPFDRAIGHFRRYNKRSLSDLVPAGMRVKQCYYLDCVGCAASFANKALLKQSLPTYAQIRFWDRAMIPFSRIFDTVLGYRIGKTVVAVFEKEK